MAIIDPRLVESALSKVDPAAFERFGQIFYGALQDREFIPLGGMHDGGAEGFDAPALLEPELFEEAATSSFLQISKEKTTRSKIRKTVKRLRQFGRNPKILTYLTSERVDSIDVEESLLSEELSCKIRIRDGLFIEAGINSSPSVQGAFRAYLEPSIEYLYRPGVADLAESAAAHTDRTLAVFLRQEVDNRRDKTGLLESVADSLILWALGETDPEKGVFMTRVEISKRIERTLPAARQFMRGVLDHRLDLMKAKDAPGGRQIRWYKKDAKYCLPYETRQIIGAENAEDDILKLQVSCAFEDKISALHESELEPLRPLIVDVCHSTLERVFELQGLEVAQFITNGSRDDELYNNVTDILSQIVFKANCGEAEKGAVRRAALRVLRATFYNSTDVERIYLQKLSRTYILLLTLKNDPKIVEYFRGMAGKFRLYVGTDLLIRAMSEQYIGVENRTTCNLLDILASSGSELILTEKTVEEIETHLRAQILEFENHYESVQSKIPFELVEYIDRLLIRAYFYAHLAPTQDVLPPKSWRSFICQFADYRDVRSLKSATSLAGYFIRRFKMTYEHNEETLAGIDAVELEEIKNRIIDAKKYNDNKKPEIDLLAYNDSLHILRVFQKRSEENERSPANKWGYRTWWLTQDAKVRRAGASASNKRGKAGFMLRPEFLLSYISFAPELAEVRESFKKIFPSTLGVRLSSRLNPDVFDKIMAQANEISSYDDARSGAIIAELTEKLKNDALRMYENGWYSEVDIVNASENFRNFL